MSFLVRPVAREELPQAMEVWRACFPEDTEAFIRFFFEKKTHLSYIWAAFDGDAMAGALHAFPITMRFFGRDKAGVFLAGIGTRPEYRKRGVAAAMIAAAHEAAYRRGACLSALQPFSFDFYRQFGYEVLSSHAPRMFPPGDDATGLEPLTPEKMLRASRAMDYDGSLVRTLGECALELEDAELGGGFGVYCEETYLLCAREEGRLIAYEAVGASPERACAALAAREGKPVSCGLPAHRLAPGEAPEPFDMLRVLDAAAFLAGAPAAERAEFILVDEQCPWQAGGYVMEPGPNGARLLRQEIPRAEAESLSPGALAGRASGFLPWAALFRERPAYGWRRY